MALQTVTEKMRRNLISCSIILILSPVFLSVVSCSKSQRGSITTVPPTTPTTVGTAPVTGDAALSCSGGVQDGFDDLPNDGRNNPLLIYQVALGGAASWHPGAPPFASDQLANLSAADQSACQPVGTGSSCDRGTSNKCNFCYRPVALSNGTSTSFARPVVLKKDAYCLMSNDGPLWVRLKAESPYNYNLSGYPGAYCYGRQANSRNGYSPYPVPYNAIRFDVYALTLRKKTTSTCQASCECNSLLGACNNLCKEDDFEYVNGPVGALVQSKVEVAVNSCSPVIALPYLGLSSSSATERVVPHITNIEVNSECLEFPNADNCPYKRINTQNCWFGTLQIATNTTQFFKGAKR